MLWRALARAAGFIARRLGRRAANNYVRRVAYRAGSRGVRTLSQYWNRVHRHSEEAARELLDSELHGPVLDRVTQGILATTGVAVAGFSGAAAYVGNMVEPSRKRRRRPGGEDPYYPGERNRDSHPGTIGLVKFRYQSNRPDPLREVKLVRAAERYAVHTVRGLNSWNSVAGTNKGYHVLALRTNGALAGDPPVAPLRVYPVHLFNLTAVPNGAATTTVDYQCNSGDLRINPQVGFVLTQAQGLNPRGNAMRWDPSLLGSLTLGTGANSTFASNPTAWSLESVSDQAQNFGPDFGFTSLGRRHYLDWIDIRFMLYGKRKHDTEVTMRIVRFTQDKFCPEYFHIDGRAVNSTWLPAAGAGALLEQNTFSDCNETLKGLVDGLVNNPITNRPSVGRTKWYSTLFEKKFYISSKDTNEANADVNAQMFKFFKRYNWVRDHSVKWTSVETADDILNEQNLETQKVDFGAQPTRLRDNIYLMITAKTPHDYGSASLDAADLTDFQNTYDLIIRKKVVQDLI